MSIPQAIDSLLDDTQSILLSLLIKLGPFAVALMPALFTAYAIFHTFEKEAGPMLALCFAVVVGLAFETVGIVATHTAIELYNGTEQGIISPIKTGLMISLVPVYVAGVAAVVWFSGDAFTPLVQALGIASPFLTCIVYIAVALARDLSNIKQAQSQAGEQKGETEKRRLDHELQLEVQRMKLNHEQKLRKIELDAEVRKEEVRTLAGVERTKPEELRTFTDDTGKATEYDELLRKVRERSDGNSFGADDLQAWLGRGKTSAYDLIGYGKDSGVVQQVGRGRYVMNGKHR